MVNVRFVLSLENDSIVACAHRGTKVRGRQPEASVRPNHICYPPDLHPPWGHAKLVRQILANGPQDFGQFFGEGGPLWGRSMLAFVPLGLEHIPYP
jgi:hypothetical protein